MIRGRLRFTALAAVATAALAVAIAPATAKAADPVVATVGETSFTTISAAVDAWEAAGGTMTLQADSQLTEPVELDKTAVLDLNGHNLLNGNVLDHKEGGLGFNGNETTSATVWIGATGDLTIRDSSDGASGSLQGEAATFSPARPVIYSLGALKIESGKVAGGNKQGGAITLEGGKASFAMRGGLVQQDDSKYTAIYANGPSSLDISGGEIRGGTYALDLRGNIKTASIAGGKIIHTFNGRSYAAINLASSTMDLVLGKVDGKASDLNIDSFYLYSSPKSTKILSGTLGEMKLMLGPDGFKVSEVGKGTGQLAFTDESFKDYLPEGSKLEKNENGTWSVPDPTPEGAYDLAQYKGSLSPSEWKAPEAPEGYAFVGWYKDAQFKDAYTSDDTTGYAYAKFVEVSDLATAQGGSLRMDDAPAKATSLRFGYKITLPERVKLNTTGKTGWTLSYGEGDAAATQDVFPSILQTRTAEDGSIQANVVITGIPVAKYQAKITSVLKLAYETPDGTTVTDVAFASADKGARSVEDVATAISKDPDVAADSPVGAYARSILDAIKAGQNAA